VGLCSFCKAPWFPVSRFLGFLGFGSLGFWFSWFLSFLVSRFLGFRASWFLGFLVSRFLACGVSRFCLRCDPTFFLAASQTTEWEGALELSSPYRCAIQSLKKPMPELIASLETFLTARATEALQETSSKLCDFPSGAWSDRYRKEAETYIAGGHYISQESEDGTVYVASTLKINSIYQK